MPRGRPGPWAGAGAPPAVQQDPLRRETPTVSDYQDPQASETSETSEQPRTAIVPAGFWAELIQSQHCAAGAVEAAEPRATWVDEYVPRYQPAELWETLVRSQLLGEPTGALRPPSAQDQSPEFWAELVRSQLAGSPATEWAITPEETVASAPRSDVAAAWDSERRESLRDVEETYSLSETDTRSEPGPAPEPMESTDADAPETYEISGGRSLMSAAVEAAQQTRKPRKAKQAAAKAPRAKTAAKKKTVVKKAPAKQAKRAKAPVKAKTKKTLKITKKPVTKPMKAVTRRAA